jgi:predicted Fe-S protein YdhL (DUF1289 family)
MVHEAGVQAEEVRSPCIRVCKFGADDVCFGCFRSTVEVRSWRFLNALERADAEALASARRQAYWGG